MSINVKEWLVVLANPALMVVHYHTQSQGLLNVLGAIYFFSLLLVVAGFVAAFLCYIHNVLPPREISFPKPAGVLWWAACVAFALTSSYLLWTGHLAVGMIYASLGIACYLLLKFSELLWQPTAE